MSWVRIWIHLVFATKNREGYFSSNGIRDQVFQHIKKYAISKNIMIDTIGGHKEHLHCLILLGREQNISNIVQLLKGESSHWINNQNYFPYKFYWQDDYYANSVSESQLNRVRKYIENQEKHHAKNSFENELTQLQELVFSDTIDQ